MLRYAANISLMFSEWAFADRFAAAASAGFTAVEFMPPPDLGPEQVATLLERNQLTQVLANIPLSPGSKGVAALPGHQAQFREHFSLGLEYAKAAGAPLLHVTTGVVKAADYSRAGIVFADNLDWALEKAADAGIALVVEAINQSAAPDYFIRSLADARQWALRHPGLGLLLDLYHAAMEGLDPCAALAAHLHFAKHIQLAGVQARHEPDPTREPFSTILSEIRNSAYAGWVGCEYVPEHGTLQGLGWLKAPSAACNG